jgi:predicted ester cyclase
MTDEHRSPTAETASAIELTRRWFTDGWLGRMPAKDLFATGFSTNGVVVGPAGPTANIAARLAGFPDLVTEIMTLFGSDNTVTVQVRWTGTHNGAYGGVAATGRRVDVRVISIWRFENGKVVENWTLQDQFSLLQQVGYLSADLTAAQVRLDPAPEP